jgi:hypothetical protein
MTRLSGDVENLSTGTFIGLARLGSHPGTHAFADFTPFVNRIKISKGVVEEYQC